MLLDPELFAADAGTSGHAAVIQDIVAEANMLAALHHDKLLSFRGVCFDSTTGHPKYLVTELADCSLRVWMTRGRGKLSLRHVLRMWCDVAEGLVYLHGFRPEPIVHRDLKPENVLVFQRNRGGARGSAGALEVDVDPDTITYKIGDVGLARFAVSVTQTVMSQAGSPLYMAPEVLAGRGYNSAVDVFSLGVMVSVIVACCSVVRNEQRSGVALDLGTRMLVAAEAEALLMSHTSSSIGELLRQCMAEDPRQRITAATLFTQLSAHLAAP